MLQIGTNRNARGRSELAKKLKVHTLPEPNYADVRVGDTFDVEVEKDDVYFIYVYGFPLSFTKEPDENGDSYKNWFTLEEE